MLTLAPSHVPYMILKLIRTGIQQPVWVELGMVAVCECHPNQQFL